MFFSLQHTTLDTVSMYRVCVRVLKTVCIVLLYLEKIQVPKRNLVIAVRVRTPIFQQKRYTISNPFFYIIFTLTFLSEARLRHKDPQKSSLILNCCSIEKL